MSRRAIAHAVFAMPCVPNSDIFAHAAADIEFIRGMREMLIEETAHTVFERCCGLLSVTIGIEATEIAFMRGWCRIPIGEKDHARFAKF